MYYDPSNTNHPHHGNMKMADEDSAVRLDAERVRALHPWRRHFARGLDLWIWTILVTWFLGAAMQVQDQTRSGLGLILFFVYVFFEAGCLSSFGTTIGKWLYKIDIKPNHGGEISFPLGFKRSLMVWWRGIGIGFPIVTIITEIVAYNRLTKYGQTTWDRDCGFTITHGEISTARWIAILAAWASVPFLILIVDMIVIIAQGAGN